MKKREVIEILDRVIEMCDHGLTQNRKMVAPSCPEDEAEAFRSGLIMQNATVKGILRAEIGKLMKPRTIKYGGYIEINELSELSELK